MKSIVTTDITASAAAKIKKGTLDHLNAMASEGPVELAKSLIGADYDVTKAYILYGCEDSNASATVFDMSAGLVLWGGELYITPAQSITVSAGQTIRFYPTPSYTTSAAADPVTFTDGTTHNIHLNQGGVWVGASTGSTVTLLDNMLRANNLPKQTQTINAFYTVNTTVTAVRNRNGLVSLSGEILAGVSSSAGDTLFTLPSGYRPAVAKVLNLGMYKIGGPTTCRLTINTNGTVVLSAVAAGPNTYNISFDNIHFYNY